MTLEIIDADEMKDGRVMRVRTAAWIGDRKDDTLNLIDADKMKDRKGLKDDTLNLIGAINDVLKIYEKMTTSDILSVSTEKICRTQ